MTAKQAAKIISGMLKELPFYHAEEEALRFAEKFLLAAGSVKTLSKVGISESNTVRKSCQNLDPLGTILGTETILDVETKG